MRYLRGLLGPVMVSFLGLVALTDTGCATTIAKRHPHLDRRAVCARPQEIEPDASEYVITEDGVPISNFHPESLPV
jgi:hypothetical protein